MYTTETIPRQRDVWLGRTLLVYIQLSAWDGHKLLLKSSLEVICKTNNQDSPNTKDSRPLCSLMHLTFMYCGVCVKIACSMNMQLLCFSQRHRELNN